MQLAGGQPQIKCKQRPDVTRLCYQCPSVKRRLLICALVSALALAAPGAALAQSAGDEQYQDPLPSQPAPDDDGGGGGDSSPGTGSGTAPSAPAAPAPAAPAAGATEATPAAAELPRTGADAALIALVGAGMLAMGAAARLAVPRRR